jgi:hypothetical protein
MRGIRAAHESGRPVPRTLGKYNVQYELLPFSGQTSFGTNGLVIGKEALASESEPKKTLPHELHRPHHSELAEGGGVDKQSRKRHPRTRAHSASCAT